jgi:hypothetical protein
LEGGGGERVIGYVAGRIVEEGVMGKAIVFVMVDVFLSKMSVWKQ